MFGVRVATVARWVREGKLSPLYTPGGHRRYRLRDIRAALRTDGIGPDGSQMEEDAARLYLQGWSIRQVAEKFDCGYGPMRRILIKRVTLRPRTGKPSEEEKQCTIW